MFDWMIHLIIFYVTIRGLHADSAPLAADCQLLTNLTDTGAWRFIRIAKQVYYVYCDGNGYTYLMHQSKNGISMRNSWEEFKAGVNLGQSNFWAGNDLFYRLTNNGLSNRLQIRLLRNDTYPNMYYNAVAYGFRIAAEQYDYRLSVERVVGADLATWTMQYSTDTSTQTYNSAGMKFSTTDRENGNCDIFLCANKFGSYWSACCGLFTTGVPNAHSTTNPCMFNAQNSTPSRFFLSDAVMKLKVILPDPNLATLGNPDDTFQYTGTSFGTADGFAAVDVLTDNDPASCIVLSDPMKPLLYITQYRPRYPFIGKTQLVLQGSGLSNVNVTAAWGVGLGSSAARINLIPVPPFNDTMLLLSAQQFCYFYNGCDQLFVSVAPFVASGQAASRLCEMYIDPCSAETNLCENNSTCVSTSRTQYTCQCLTGYQGQWCEQRLCTTGYKGVNCLTVG